MTKKQFAVICVVIFLSSFCSSVAAAFVYAKFLANPDLMAALCMDVLHEGNDAD